MLFFIEACFARFDALGFTGSELPAVNSLGDAVLLVVFALRNGRRLVRGGSSGAGSGLLSKCGRRTQSNHGRRTQNKFAMSS